MQTKLEEFEERLEVLERRLALAESEDELLTVRDASRLAKVSERWIYEQARTDRRFPAVKIGSLVRIQKGAFLRRLVAEGR